MATGTPVAAITPSQLTFDNAYSTTTSFDRWVNGLWFTSLSLSLVSALLSVLVKQWLQYYISALSGTPRDRVLIRHFRFMGLATWKVPQIVGALPVLLHIALFMFMAGLVIFVWVLNVTMASVILSITTICFIFYFLSNLLASLYPSCSYTTPIADALLYVGQVLQWIGNFRMRHGRHDRVGMFRGQIRVFGHVFWLFDELLNTRARRTVEPVAATELTDDVLLSALTWLRTASSDPSSRIVIREAFAGQPFRLDPEHISPAVRNDIWHEVFISAPSHLQPGTMLSYCSIGSHRRLGDRTYNILVGLGHHSPTIQALRAILYSRDASPNRELLIGIVSDQMSFPPWLWERLFEHDSEIPTANPLKLLILLLEVLKEAEILQRVWWVPRARANWSLPSTVGLVELCQSDGRMANTIFQFACRIIQHDSHTELLQNLGNGGWVLCRLSTNGGDVR